MDDNELDRLFGYDGGPEGSGGDDTEHLQIVDKKDKKPSEPSKSDDSGAEETGGESSDGKEKESPEEGKKDGESEAETSESPEESGDKESGDVEKEGSSEPAEGEKPEEDGSGKEEDGKEEGKEEGSDKEEKKPSGEKTSEPGKKKKRRFKLTGFGLAVIVFFVLVVTLILLFLFLPIFRVREVTIEGNIELSDEEVLEAVGLKYNAHLMSGVSGNILDVLSLNYGKTEERLRRENPYISDISISVRIPSEVFIKVQERRKIAYVSTPDGYIALDRNGTVLELNSGKQRQKVSPIIYGISVESAKLGERVKVRDENSYKKALVVLGSILAADNATIGDNFNMFEHTTEVRVLPSGYVFLTIYTASGKPVQIKLNKTDKINENMAWLLYAFNSNAFDQVTIKGTLDMTGDEFIFNPSTK